MNILKYLQNLFKGHDNLIIQTAIFALCGIMAISFNEITAAYTGNSLYAIFTSPAPFGLAIYTILAIMIFIYFVGYSYKFVNNLFNTENNEVVLPSVSLNCFTTFVKVFPVMLVWGIYLSLTILIGLLLFKNFFALLLYSVLLFILLPFMNLVFIKFAKDFKYTKEIFNPLTIFKVVKKTFKPLILFLIQFIVLSFIISVIIGYFYKLGTNASYRTMQLIIILGILCISTYIQQILNLTYFQGLVKIVKEKL